MICFFTNLFFENKYTYERTYLIIILSVFISIESLVSQTTLYPGDIVIVGYNADNPSSCGGNNDGDDRMYWVCLKDITSGTVLYITDNGFERVTCSSNTWGDQEGVYRITYSGPTITAGTVNLWKLSAAGANNFNSENLGTGWTKSLVTGFSAVCNLTNSGGDQFYFTQGGTWSNPVGASNASYTGGRVLFGLNLQATWACNINNTNDSELHPDVIPCAHIEPSSGGPFNFIRYNGPMTAADQLTWLERVTDWSNWTTDASCAAFNANFAITSLPMIANSSTISGSPLTGCSPETSTLTFNLPTTGGPFTVVYTDGTTDFTLTGISNGYTVVVSPSQPTTYSLESITGISGCILNLDGTDASDVTLNFGGSPTTSPNAASPASICEGGTATLSTVASGGSPVGTYTSSFSGGSGTFGSITYSGTNSANASVVVSGASIGVNTYNVTSSLSSCTSTTGNIALKVFDVPSISSAVGTCSNGADGTITVTAAAINNANFTGGDIGSLEYSYNGGTSWGTASVATGLAPGYYTVCARNSAYTACSVCVSVIVAGKPVTTPNPASLANICEGSNATLATIASGGNASNSVGDTLTGLSLAIPNNSLTGVSSAITLGGSGTISSSNTIAIFLNIDHDSDGDLDIFLVGPGNCGTLPLAMDNGGSGDDYINTVLLTSASNIIGTGGNNTAPFTGTYRPEGTITTLPVLTGGTGGGSYSLPATALNGCSVSGNWTLWAFDDATGNLGTITSWGLVVNTPQIYTSAFSGGSGTIGSVSYSAPQNANASASVTAPTVGLNTYQTTSSVGGCTSDPQNITLKVFDIPNITAAVGCGGSITVTATINNANFTGGDIGTIEYALSSTGPFQSSNILTSGLPAFVYVRNSANPLCVSAPFPVTAGSSPTAVINPVSATICGSGSTTLTASGGNSYVWSTTETSASISVSPISNTTYTVTATGSNGCTDTESVTVTVASSPAQPGYGTNSWNVLGFNGLNNYTNFYGYYNTVGDAVSNPPGGGGPEDFEFNTTYGEGWNLAQSPSSATGYSGCTMPVDSFSIQAKRMGFPCGYYYVKLQYYDDNLEVIIDQDGDGTPEFNSAYIFPPCSSGCGTDIWQGYLGPNSKIDLKAYDVNLDFVVHVVFYRDVPDPAHPQVDITSTIPTTIDCITTTGSIANTTTGGTLPYTYNWSGPTAIGNVEDPGGLSAGTYNVTVTDKAGCTDMGTATINANIVPPTAVINPVSQTLNCTTTSATLTASGGVSYNWGSLGSTAGVTVNLTNTPATTNYTVTVTAANGCTDTEVITVTVNNAAPTAVINPVS